MPFVGENGLTQLIKEIKKENLKYKRIYNSLKDLGLTAGSETLESIIAAMSDNSCAIIAITNENNTAIYPYADGLLCVEKYNQYRTYLTYLADFGDKLGYMWFSTYIPDTAKCSDWISIYTSNSAADLSGALPTAGGTMTGNINLKNSIAIQGIGNDGAIIPLILLYGADVFVGGGSNNNLYLRSKKTPIAQVNETNYKIYHEGNKPTANDVNAIPITGNTPSNPITGNLYIQNYVKWRDSKNQKEINMVGFNETNKKAIYGGGNNTGGIVLDTMGGPNSVDIWDGVNGKTYKLYHEGNKPTANDVKAIPITGNTKDSPITGSIYLQNNKEIIGMTTDGSTASIARVNSNNKVILGNVYKNTNLQSYSNPTVTLNEDKTYKLYHEGYAPKAVWSAGDKTAETGTEAPNAGHMAMNTIYNNGYPCSYGNLLTLSGSGKSELAMEWTGSDTPATGRLYYRSKRDTGGVAWGDWKKIAYTDDVPNKAYTAGTLDHCARSADTGNTNTNKYYKLATFNITENYGSVSAEYSIGFNGHGMATSPHHKLGVWIKRQDSTFNMDLRVWGALNDNYATYLLVKTGQYQATLYAFLRTQYCTLYMSCLSRMYNGSNVEYYTGASPITSVGSTNVFATYMDKPSAIGGVECIFSGSLTSTGALDNSWKNKGSCVDRNGYFTVPEDGVYHVIGRAWKTNSVYLCNVTTGSKTPMPVLSNLAPSDSTVITFNTPFKGTKNESYLLRQNESDTKLNYAVFTILKLN